MKKSFKRWAKQPFGRQHLVWTLILAVTLVAGFGFAYAWPSAFAEADSEGHVHSVLCCEGVALGCDDAAHEHTLNCLTGLELVCEEEHSHGLDCYATVSAELVCGVAEGQEAGHVHNQPGCECVAIKILTCTQLEHEHTADCQPEHKPNLVKPEEDGDGWYVYETGVEESDEPVNPYEGEDVDDDEFGGFADDDNFGFIGEDDKFGVDQDESDDADLKQETPDETEDDDEADNFEDTEDNNETGNSEDTEEGSGADDPENTEDGDDAENPEDTEDNDETDGSEDTEGQDVTDGLDNAVEDVDPVAGDESSTTMAAKKIYGLPVPLAELPEDVQVDDAAEYICGQTEHTHSADCYTVVYLCRETVVINVPELPTSGKLNLLDGVTVEPAEIDGKPLLVAVLAVEAEDANGKYHEPLWDFEDNTLTIEADVTYEVTYVAYYLNDEPTEDSAMFAMLADDDSEQAGFPVMAGLAKVQTRGTGVVAKIGETPYNSLQAAINVVGNNQTIVLIANIKESVVAEKSKTFTLDLNGNTITGNGGTVITIKNGSVILDDSKGSGRITGGTGTMISAGIAGWNEIVSTDIRHVTKGKPNIGQSMNNVTTGGGVLVQSGATFTMNAGTIDKNTAKRGGGIAVARGGNLNIYGGNISNNTATEFEGGGIFCAGKGEINPTNSNVSIHHNTTQTTGDLGGGGIFVENKGTMKIFNAVITENTAYGLGGGVAGCLHGLISNISPDTAAIYNNTANKTARLYNYDNGPSSTTSNGIFNDINNLYCSTIDHD